MKRLEQLPEITEKALGGLTAGQHLKLRIEKAAVSPAPQRRRTSAWVPALSFALVLALALVWLAYQLLKLLRAFFCIRDFHDFISILNKSGLYLV